MSVSPVIIWFRQDLRLADNLALSEAVTTGPIIPVYILDDNNARAYSMGGASRCWLHHALHALNKSLNGRLNVYSGEPAEILLALANRHQAKAIYWNRCYEPWRIARDKKIKTNLQRANITSYSFNASLLWEPWQVLKKDGTPYKVFTPFYRRGCLQRTQPRLPIKTPDITSIIKDDQSIELSQLLLLPTHIWHENVSSHWEISEKAAHDRLNQFVCAGIENYQEGRNYPAQNHTSNLSPYLHFGQISPNQVWYNALGQYGESDKLDTFHSELGWREFAYYLLYHFPKLTEQNIQGKFDAFPWQNNTQLLLAWQRGQTGHPIVDAGMRELWQTGTMHNRVRMIVGSFLVKNLLIHWHHGRDWFWDCLFDADLASNSVSWQWIAGCGADAAPYFRIFNPITQGQKFDKLGKYTKKYVPELSNLPEKYLFNPWEAPENMLSHAGVALGRNYPAPIVDLKRSRERALQAYAEIKSSSLASIVR